MRSALLILVALALTATVALADQWEGVDVGNLIESAPGREEHPDADAVYLMIQKLIDVGDDGTVVTRRNVLTKILTLMGREKYGNATFLYNSDVEKAEIVKGVTTRSSGRTVDIDEDAVNDITPAFLTDATIYANVLNKVVSFPVAGAGSTTELQMLETLQPETDKSFSGTEYFAASEPLLRKEVVLSTPSGVTVNSELVPGYVGFQGRQDFGDLEWTVEDVPAVVPEADSPPNSELYPRLIYSSYSDWNEASAFFAGKFYPHVTVGGEFTPRVKELLERVPLPEMQIQVLFEEVALYVRNIYLSLGLGGYEPNDAELVDANKYGDTRDKAVLLVSLLRTAGFEAYPALVHSTRSTFIESVPTLKQFDRILIAVPEADGYRFLDPFLDDVRYGYVRWGRGNTALVVKDDGTGELVQIPPFDLKENASRTLAVVRLNADGSAQIQAICDLSGYFDRRARRTLKDATPIEADKIFDQAASSISSSASSEDYSYADLANIRNPVNMRQQIAAPDFATSQGGMMIVRLPAFPLESASMNVYPSLSERELPFDLPCEADTEYKIVTMIPEGYEVVRKPEEISIESPSVDASLTCEWAPATRQITWIRNILYKQKTVTVEEYAEFKEALDTLLSPKNSLILLKKA